MAPPKAPKPIIVGISLIAPVLPKDAPNTGIKWTKKNIRNKFIYVISIIIIALSIYLNIIISPEFPIIYNLISRKPENPNLQLCASLVGVPKTVPRFTKEAYYKILSVTGCPWKYVTCWGIPSHIVATGRPSYPYKWEPKPGSSETQCAVMFGKPSGAGIKKKSYKKKNKKVLKSKKHNKR